MIVELITIGREILDGRVVDTNSTEMARHLSEIGITPRFGQRVDDDPPRMKQAFQIAEDRAQVVLVTGGLGPTSDDLTAEVFAEFVGEPLELNALALSQIENRFAAMKRPMIEAQKKQALLPRGAEVMENLEGTAPGFVFQSKKALWFFMPGVPREMLYLLTHHVLPRLPAERHFRKWQWATHFTSEGSLQELLKPVIAKLRPGWEFSFRTRMPENHVALLADTAGDCHLEDEFEARATEIRQLLAGQYFCEGEKLLELEELVIQKAIQKQTQLTTVESCTGGLIASRLTDVAGSSKAFWGSQIAYDNEAKIALGVDPKLLASHGAVSAEVAQALALQGARRLQSRGLERVLCVSTTGIAGPSGGSDDKPVGLCWIGWSDGASLHSERFQARPGLKRSDYKRFFSQKALDRLRLAL